MLLTIIIGDHTIEPENSIVVQSTLAAKLEDLFSRTTLRKSANILDIKEPYFTPRMIPT